MPPAATWVKMAIGGTAMCIGGPALVYYVTPSEEELFKRYNPELQRRALASRQERQEDFDKFIGRIKEYSKDDKRPIWTVWEQEGQRKQADNAVKAVEAKRDEQERIEALKAQVKAAATSQK